MNLSVSDIFKIPIDKHSDVKNIILKGFVRSHRQTGKINFIQLSDGSTIKKIQIVYEGELSKLDYMSTIIVKGTLVKSPAKQQDYELVADEIQCVGDCNPEKYPLPRKYLTLPYLRQFPHLRMRCETISSILRIRHKMIIAVHNFFNKQDFLNIHTPLITGSDCEGAGETFKVTSSPNFFPRDAYLTVSGQLEGEMAATALGKIYTFGPTFRAEKSDTSRHLAEFWMIEPEMCWYDLDDTIKLAMELLKYCVKKCKKWCKNELEFLKVNLGDEMNFEIITYEQAIDILNKAESVSFKEVKWGDDLSSEMEKYLCEKHYKMPLVIKNYPKEIKSFYMKQSDDGMTVNCFDLLLPGIGEVIGGSEREIRMDKLLAEMKLRNMDITKYEKYIDLRRFGNVPHAGFGLGFERLIRYLTGIEHIRDVIPFPVYFGHL